MSLQNYCRYVAIGDSSTEGLDDPDGRGGYRGWANRLAERIAREQGSLLYANLGVRGLCTREIREQQLPRALEMKPDLATVFSGTNDVMSRRFDAKAITADIEHMQKSLIQGGATVLTFTLPDLTPVMPLARFLASRVRAMNRALSEASARTGAILVDFARHPVATDLRLWSEDRIHVNSLGHERIAAALAQAIGLAGTDGRWAEPLPDRGTRGPVTWIAAEIRWGRRHLLPWIWDGLCGRSSSDARQAKRPRLEPMA